MVHSKWHRFGRKEPVLEGMAGGDSEYSGTHSVTRYSGSSTAKRGFGDIMHLGWTDPKAQIWHVEAALLASLVIRSFFRKDDRPRWQALMCVLCAVDLASLYFVRTGHISWYDTIAAWHWILALPLTAMALIEAGDYRPTYHRSILCWWIAVCMCGQALVGFSPWANYGILLGNCVAYLAWWVWV